MCGGVRTAGQRSQHPVRIPLRFEFMADSPADEALGEEDSQPVDEEDGVNEGDMTCTISLVHQLKIGRNVIWYPDVQQVQGTDGGLFFRLSKHDAVLTRVVLGKGLNRHKKVGAIRTLANLEFWETLRKLRREACDAALKHQLEEAAGQAVAKCRAARDDDRYLVSKSVVVKLPGVATAGFSCDERDVRVLWQVRGDAWLELSSDIVLHVVCLLRESPTQSAKPKPIPQPAAEHAGSPKTPRRKRRVKRRRSCSVEDTAPEAAAAEAEAHAS